MNSAVARWEKIYSDVPLTAVPSHFSGMTGSPFLFHYLSAVLRLTPKGGRTLETGIGSGYGAVWLSLRGVRAQGIDYSPTIVERARQVNDILGGHARFETGDLFDLREKNSPRYDVIHSQGVFEHFTVPQIRAALAQQVACANHVVFSVPSVFYPFEPEFGNERLMPLEEWERILAPFSINDLRYYGDPSLGGQEQILCILRGQPADEELVALMHPPAEPYKEGVSAIVHTRNEAARISECLQTLVGWTDEIIVCDMESEDDTVDIASRFTDRIVRHPRIPNFDRARNVSAMRALHEWVFYLDADERVPAALGQHMRAISRSGQTDYDALLIPFRHHFSGHWMRSMYPGYTAPRMLRNGKFVFNPRLHSGAQVDGRVVAFPADDPELALVHYSFDSLSHYLDKLNRYTDGESLDMWRDGQEYHWQNAIAHFIHDFKSYYEGGAGTQDGVHGFLYAFQSAFYRFFQHGKLYELRYRNNQLMDREKTVPANLEEMLEYALRLCRQKPRPQVPQVTVSTEAGSVGVVWTGPVRDRSGYGDESRNLLLALDTVGVAVSAQPLPWGEDASLSEEDRGRLDELAARSAAPGFAQVVHTFGSHLERHPQAGLVIGRTVFETDRLPREWVERCNRMDAIWVPSEFNRRTFTDAGVDPTKITVVPECLDASRYHDLPTRSQLARRKDVAPVVREVARSKTFTFLSVFDWTLHKGWDVLLRAFFAEFAADDHVQLILKIWSSNGYTDGQILGQAQEFAQREFGIDLAADPRVRFVQEYLNEDDLQGLYIASHAYVLPSRGEGWGRPYMEAMACGLPVIATGWGGNTAFMTPENSYLVDSRLVPVPEVGWREVATYKGHRWAEPDAGHLRSLLRRVHENREEAIEIGARARQHILENFSREAVGPIIAAELESARVRAESHVPQEAAPAREAPVRVRWEGAIFRQHSLGHVNRELCLGLIDAGVDLSLVSTEPDDFSPDGDERLMALAERCFATLSGPADVHVRHGFPPRFGLPAEGRFVLMQPWEYGYLPKDWVSSIAEQVSEIWCNSGYVRDVYKNSGVPEEKLQMVPLGVDTDVFHPGVLPYVFTDEPGASRLALLPSPGETGPRMPFVFLFAGGTLHRKGFDILLEAYLKAFSAFDDVILVVKDTCTTTLYQGQNHRNRLLELAADASRPRIVYLDQDLPDREMAGVYAQANCLVAPYRGEGFCLPVLEAMACGLPVIVPRGGATDDFVDESVGWMLPARKVVLDGGRIGEWECAGQPWLLEVSTVDLARQMRQIVAQPDEGRRRGVAGARRVQDGWTWRRSVERVRERIEALCSTPTIDHVEELSNELQYLGELGQCNSGRRIGRRLPTLSLCMIVKDEERVLGDCLSSIKPWVDEIVVVDTGSTDRTVAIAREHGARVYAFPWTESFSEARNESLKYATGDWVLWMDADDTILPECGVKLREAVLLAEEKVLGLIMQVRIPPAPGEVGRTVVDHVKLFRNGLGVKFEGRIHEQILEPIYRLGGEVRRTDLYVVHSGYDYSPEGQKRKRVRDLSLLELDLAERPDHPFVLFNIGMTAYYMKDYLKAVQALERCLAVSNPQESTIRKVYAMLAGCSLETHDLIGAKRRVEQGLDLYPRDPELLFRAGIVYKEIGNLGKAEECYLNLLGEREVGHIDSLDETLTGFKAHHNLALVYQEMGRLEEAAKQFRSAVEKESGFVPSWVGLGGALIDLKRFQDAEVAIDQLQILSSSDASALRAILQGRMGH